MNQCFHPIYQKEYSQDIIANLDSVAKPAKS